VLVPEPEVSLQARHRAAASLRRTARCPPRHRRTGSRSGWPPAPHRPPAAELVAAGLNQDDDQTRLLNYSAALSRARRAGFRPPEAGARPAPDPADEDGKAPASLAAERRLAELLRAGEHDLTAEWLRLLAARDPARRPPDVLLPALLTAAASRPQLRSTLLPVLGPLAAWLARRNDEWAWARGAGGPDVASVWETGGIDDRRALAREAAGG